MVIRTASMIERASGGWLLLVVVEDRSGWKSVLLRLDGTAPEDRGTLKPYRPSGR